MKDLFVCTEHSTTDSVACGYIFEKDI